MFSPKQVIRLMTMTRQRIFQNPLTGKTWGTLCDGASVTVTTGAPGKEKSTLKPQADVAAALAWAEKEEWARLKKGFVLVNPDALAGEPRMHRQRTHGYMGAIVIENVAGKLLCNDYQQVRPGDKLFLLDENAKRFDLPDLPAPYMAWEARYMPAVNLLLVRADHQVLSLTLGAAGFEQLHTTNLHNASCIDAAGTYALWYAEPNLEVKDLSTGKILLSKELTPEKYHGHSTQMEAALSPGGVTVAYCVQAGEIVLCNVASGNITGHFSGGFEMITKLAFTHDGRYLIAQEQYGDWKLMCLDLSSGQPREGWPLLAHRQRAFALSPDGQNIAIAHHGHIDILDLASQKSYLGFKAEHVAKSCAVVWMGNHALAVHTYGCASIYNVSNR